MPDYRIAQTEFVIEATDTEKLFLWQKWHEKLTWEQDCHGLVIHLGELDGRPVNLSLQWACLNGRLVMFYDCISQVVDHKMVEEWLRLCCSPRYDKGNRLAYTNAMNFHIVVDYLREVGGPTAETSPLQLPSPDKKDQQ